MCRLGRLNDAVKVVCLEMGKNQEDVEPDEETVKQLFRFASREDQRAEIRKRIQKYLPRVWDKLSNHLRRDES